MYTLESWMKNNTYTTGEDIGACTALEWTVTGFVSVVDLTSWECSWEVDTVLETCVVHVVVRLWECAVVKTLADVGMDFTCVWEEDFVKIFEPREPPVKQTVILSTLSKENRPHLRMCSNSQKFLMFTWDNEGYSESYSKFNAYKYWWCQEHSRKNYRQVTCTPMVILILKAFTTIITSCVFKHINVGFVCNSSISNKNFKFILTLVKKQNSHRYTTIWKVMTTLSVLSHEQNRKICLQYYLFLSINFIN